MGGICKRKLRKCEWKWKHDSYDDVHDCWNSKTSRNDDIGVNLTMK